MNIKPWRNRVSECHLTFLTTQNQKGWNRREFLTNLAVAGSAALLGLHSDAFAAEPPPETKRIRIPQIPSTCRSPEWVAEELLRAEGFTDVQYTPVQGTQGVERALASGEADLAGHFAAPVILRLEAGDPIVMLGGEHVGCFELLGSERIRTIRHLKGRSVPYPSWTLVPMRFSRAWCRTSV
jgi:NitT/TauT family transport system substrate-binding protein